MTIRQVELGTFLGIARALPKTFDALITSVAGDLSLAYLGAMFETAQRGSALDYADFHEPALDADFARARTAAEADRRVAAWRALQRDLEAQLPVVWIYHARGVQ